MIAMGSFEIIGGHRLKGEITPQGAKNEALQVISAVLLTPERVVMNKVPDIRDVNLLIDILADLGVKVEKTGPESYAFQADDIDLAYLKSPEFKKKGASLRGSIMIIGPLLARFGQAFMPHPGGDKIGRRRLDTHFIGLKTLGAHFHFDEDKDLYVVDAEHLSGCYMHLDEASVTGTANIVMAAVLAEGTTTIFHEACEPYLYQL